MHIVKCKRISSVGFRHDRILILSTHNLYMVGTKGATKKFPINELKYLVKSLTSYEVLLYFEQNYDTRFILDSRDELIAYLNLRFAQLCPKKHLRMYGAPEENLKKYKASKHRKSSQGYVFDTEPP